MSDLDDTTWPPTSDISIYQVKPTKRSMIAKMQKEAKDTKCQKIWVFCHSIIFILIACETIYLLNEKEIIMKQFYNTKEQCCYCAWIARNGKFNDKKEIEYSHCQQTYNQKYNTPQICTFDGTQYCQNNQLLWNDRHVSTTSTFLFYPFPKHYLYYGILGIILVMLYCSFIILATFKYVLRLSSLLFVGNIVIAIQLYYNYIKAYQYTKINYSSDAICVDAPPGLNNLYEQSCYQNTLGRFTSQLLTVMVSFFMIYFIYPVVFYIFSCLVKRCPFGYKCSVLQSFVERILLYIGVVGGLFSVFLCFVVLMVVIARTKNDQFIMDLFHVPRLERYVCITVGMTLFVATISVFFLPHCRSRCKLIVRVRNIPQWKEAIVDDDELDTFQPNESDDRRSTMESVDMTQMTSKSSHSKRQSSNKLAHSPLLEQDNT